MPHIHTTIPLSSLTSSHTGVIHSLLAGHSLISRLVTLGFTPGTELTMVQNFGWGPIIVEVRDARIALGRGEAHKIHVVESHGREHERSRRQSAEEHHEA